MSRSVILFLPAHPAETTRLALDEECAAIERELKRAPGRDDFECRSEWAVTADDLQRHLLDLSPTILHFSGHGRAPELRREGTRDVEDASAEQGLLLAGDGGQPQPVTSVALTEMIRTMAPGVRLVVLDACYSDAQAEALRDAVGCTVGTVGMRGPISDDAARAFAVGFYRALASRRPIRSAYEHAVSALMAKRLAALAQPRCLVREEAEVDLLLLGGAAPGVAVPIAQPSLGAPSASAAHDEARQDDGDADDADHKRLNDRRSSHEVAMRQRTARLAANMVLMFVVGLIAVGVGLATYFQSSRPLFAIISSVVASLVFGAALLSNAWGNKLASHIERSLAERG
jgi:hypothetical protein